MGHLGVHWWHKSEPCGFLQEGRISCVKVPKLFLMEVNAEILNVPLSAACSENGIHSNPLFSGTFYRSSVINAKAIADSGIQESGIVGCN